MNKSELAKKAVAISTLMETNERFFKMEDGIIYDERGFVVTPSSHSDGYKSLQPDWIIAPNGDWFDAETGVPCGPVLERKGAAAIPDFVDVSRKNLNVERLKQECETFAEYPDGECFFGLSCGDIYHHSGYFVPKDKRPDVYFALFESFPLAPAGEWVDKATGAMCMIVNI